MKFTAKDRPAEIILIYPQASDLFKEHKIDFCCGGDRSLEEQCAKQQINLSALLTVLNEKYFDWKEAGHVAKDWFEVSLEELVDHIIHHEHLYLKNELPAISEYVTRVFHVHGYDEPHLKQLHQLFHHFKLDMEHHMLREERELFPLIRQYGQEPRADVLEEILQLNAEMEKEHDESGDLLKEIRNITDDFTVPVHACGTYRVTYSRLAELEENTFQHIHLENNVLFKRLES